MLAEVGDTACHMPLAHTSEEQQLDSQEAVVEDHTASALHSLPYLQIPGLLLDHHHTLREGRYQMLCLRESFDRQT